MSNRESTPIFAPIAEYIYDRVHSGIENPKGKSDYINRFEQSLVITLILAYFPILLITVDGIMLLVLGTSIGYIDLPLFALAGVLLAFVGGFGPNLNSVLPEESPWRLTKKELLAITHCGRFLSVVGIVYTIFGILNPNPGLSDAIVLFLGMTTVIVAIYSESVGYRQRFTGVEGDRQSLTSVQSEILPIKDLLWYSTKQTVSLTGLSLTLLVGIPDMVATRFLAFEGFTPISIPVAIVLYLVTFYMYGLSMKVFLNNGQIRVSYRFFSQDFRRIIYAIIQTISIMVISSAVMALCLYVFGTSNLLEGEPKWGPFMLIALCLFLLLFIHTTFVFVPYSTISSGGFLASFKESWKLANGYRANILYIGLSGYLIGLIIALVFFFPTSVLIGLYPGEVPNWVQHLVLPSFVVYLICLFSNMYNNLKTSKLDVD